MGYKIMKLEKDILFGQSVDFWVCVGQSGSGKTELALNLSKVLREYGKKVGIVDLDYSKGHFRCRDQRNVPEFKEIPIFFNYSQELDTPYIPGTQDIEQWKSCETIIIDVAGDLKGICCLGTLSALFSGKQVNCLHVWNPYRGCMEMAEEMDRELKWVIRAIPHSNNIVVANPHIGSLTTEMVWRAGVKRMAKEMGEKRMGLYLCPYSLKDILAKENVFPLHLYVQATVNEL